MIAEESLFTSEGSDAPGAFAARGVIVQIGSRRNYAIPIALAQERILERLYTDWYASKGFLARLAGSLTPWLPARFLARAAARQVDEIDPNKVVHFPWFAIRYKWMKHRAGRRGETARAYVQGGKVFCEAVLKHGLPPCELVYCFSSVAKEIFQHLDGTTTLRVLDQGIPPLAYDDRLLREQEAAYAAWTRPRPLAVGVEEYAARQREEWAVADLILCPSKFCSRALIEERAPEQKIRLLPFGIHSKFFPENLSREPGDGVRVLFAGNTPIRKGLPDLVSALELLNTSTIRGIFAGETNSLTPYAVARAGRVGTLLGSVSRLAMPSLYRQADVFVLPTVSDVFPSVVLEAMAAGIPVIVTDHCGSADAVRDGLDGFIVPIRSPDRIAEKLELLARDPELRAEMGRNAAQRAQEYSIDAYRRRLLPLLTAAMAEKG